MSPDGYTFDALAELAETLGCWAIRLGMAVDDPELVTRSPAVPGEGWLLRSPTSLATATVAPVAG